MFQNPFIAKGFFIWQRAQRLDWAPLATLRLGCTNSSIKKCFKFLLCLNRH